jgi:hypothetical protein
MVLQDQFMCYGKFRKVRLTRDVILVIGVILWFSCRRALWVRGRCGSAGFWGVNIIGCGGRNLRWRPWAGRCAR